MQLPGFLLVSLLLAGCGFGQERAAATDDGSVDAIVAPYVSLEPAPGKAPGIWVALSRGGKQQFYNYGNGNAEQVFEMGSITKVFTVLLAAMEAVHSNDAEAFLQRPVVNVIPALAKAWSAAGEKKEITLKELATHTAGLPFRIPPEMLPRDSDDQNRMYAVLARAPMKFSPGEGWFYSNCGMSLLGAALETLAGRNFETLVRERITTPLGLRRTAKWPDGVYAKGFRVDEQTHQLKDAGATIAGAVTMPTGGLRTTAADLLQFTETLRQPPENIGLLKSAIELIKKLVTETPCPGKHDGECAMGLGIQMWDRMFYKTGQTDGFHSVIAFDGDTSVVVSANQNSAATVTAIAKRILESGAR